jgi:NADH-quinone oxidoreductase subunit L
VVTESSELLRWIALLPLMAAVYHGVMLALVRRPTPRAVTIALSCGSVMAAFGVSFLALGELLQLPDGQRMLVDNIGTWIGVGVGPEAFSADFSLQLDALSAVMALVVTGVGSLIHIYSVGYMDDDHRDDDESPSNLAGSRPFPASRGVHRKFVCGITHSRTTR